MGWTGPAEAVFMVAELLSDQCFWPKLHGVTRLSDAVCAAASGQCLEKETKQNSGFYLTKVISPSHSFLRFPLTSMPTSKFMYVKA